MTSRPNDAAVIRVEHVSLRYRITREKVTSIKEYAIRRLKRDLGFTDFWALKDVSIEVKKGEVFGIVGRNGAGKTTLLKVIARVLRPISGRVVVRGLVAPLLGLGAGFNNELTGRENVFLSGATLGFSVQEMRARFDEIVDFAGVGDFLDAPLRTYSTGMRARLAFAVATAIKPDILLLDEILSVGDSNFQEKCTHRLRGFREGGATVLLVSHNPRTIKSLCDRAVLLHRGQVQNVSSATEILQQYRDLKEEIVDTRLVPPATSS